MRTRRTNKVLTMSVLCVAVLALAIAFAAFSNTLTISSSANVTPNANTFNVDFSTSSSSVVAGSVTPVKSPTSATFTATPGTINNSAAPTLTGLSAEFTEPGQSVTYNLYAYNAGEFLAYLNAIMFNGEKVCTPGTNTTASLVTAACEGITLSVKVGSEAAVTATKTGITNHTLATTTAEAVQVVISYVSGAARADGPFTVSLPDVSLTYSTIANYEVPTTLTLYRFSTDSISIGDEINPSAYTTDATTLGNDFYLKHVVENNVVTESYVCVVVNDKESCVKGGSPDYYGYADNAANYTGNALILKGLQDEGLSCSFDMTNSVCTSSGSFSLTANSSGGVIASGPRGRCIAGGSSGSSCTVNG